MLSKSNRYYERTSKEEKLSEASLVVLRREFTRA